MKTLLGYRNDRSEIHQSLEMTCSHRYIFIDIYLSTRGLPKSNVGFPGGSVVKNPTPNAGGAGLVPGSRREGNGNPLQYSCLGKSHGQSWRATVHGMSKSQTRMGQIPLGHPIARGLEHYTSRT